LYLESLSLKHFRSYDILQTSFSPKSNLILGKNGAGKSNILEAVYLLSTSKSFRNTIDQRMVKWGEDGFHYIWLNKNTAWTWRDIYRDELTVLELVEQAHEINSPVFTEVVTQVVRELLLLHSSDWQFLISTWSARDYAEMRFANHHSAIGRLVEIANRVRENDSLSDADKFYLEEMKKRDHPFPELSLEWLADLPEIKKADH